MTTSELVSWKTIDLVFEVGTFLRWMLGNRSLSWRESWESEATYWSEMIFNMQRGMISAKCGTKGDCNAHWWWGGGWRFGHPQMQKLHFFPLRPNNCTPQRCDLDRNGKLDYQEFKAMIFRSRERKEALLREQEEQARKGQMYDLACSNQITTFLFSFSMNILFVKTPTFCFRPSWRGGESQLGRKRRRCRRTRRRRRRRKKAPKRRNKDVGSYFSVHSTRSAVRAGWKDKKRQFGQKILIEGCKCQKCVQFVL